jgi:hypothetical protein
VKSGWTRTFCGTRAFAEGGDADDHATDGIC